MSVERAEQLEQAAGQHDAEAAASFERCDTDGFVSQWAHGILGQEQRMQAEIERNGGTAEFPGLFEIATGDRIKAKIVYVDDRYSYSGGKKALWLVLDERNEAICWIPAGAKGPRSKLFINGLMEAQESAPAEAFINGTGYGLSGSAWAAMRRTDQGYPDTAKIWSRA